MPYPFKKFRPNQFTAFFSYPTARKQTGRQTNTENITCFGGGKTTKKALVRRHLRRAHPTPTARKAGRLPHSRRGVQQVARYELTNTRTNERTDHPTNTTDRNTFWQRYSEKNDYTVAIVATFNQQQRLVGLHVLLLQRFRPATVKIAHRAYGRLPHASRSDQLVVILTANPYS